MALACVEVDVAVKRVSIIQLGSYRRQSICIQPARHFRVTWFNPKHHAILTSDLLRQVHYLSLIDRAMGKTTLP